MGFPFQSRFFKRGPPGARLVRGVNVKRGTTEWGEDARFWSDLKPDLALYELRVGDVVIGMDGSRLGENFAVIRDSDLPALLVQRVTRLRARDGMDQGFLRYLVCNPSFTSYIKAVHTGTAIPHVSGGQIARFPVRIPILAEQRAIARVLGSLDDKIELNRRMNQTLEDICRALFKFWFVDFGPVRAKQEGRWKKGESLPGMHADMWNLWPSEFEESEIGEIPRGWKVQPLAEVATFTRGVSYRGTDLADSRTALVSLKCAGKGGVYREDGLKPYRGEYKEAQVVEAGDVVVSHTDVTQRAEVIGRAYRVRPSSRFSRLVASLDMAIVRPSRGGPSNDYLAYALSEERFRDHAYGYTNGTTVLHLSSLALPDYPLLVPPPEVVRRFSEAVTPQNRLVDVHGLESDGLSRSRDALLPKLLSGEIRVKVDT